MNANSKPADGRRKVPFLGNRAPTKSTPVKGLVEELKLTDGVAAVPEHLLSEEEQKRIDSLAKDVDPQTYVMVEAKNPSKISKPLVAPWEDLSTRRRVKAFNLCPSEALKARIVFLSEVMGISQHEVCLEMMEKPLIKRSDEEFEKLKRKGG